MRSGARLRPPRRRPRSSLHEGWTLAGPGSRTAPGPHRRRRTAPGIARPPAWTSPAPRWLRCGVAAAVAAAPVPRARCARPSPEPALPARGAGPRRGPRREPLTQARGLRLLLPRRRRRRCRRRHRRPHRGVLKPRDSKGWCAWPRNCSCCWGCCCLLCTSPFCADPEPPTGRTRPPATSAGPSCRITSTWRVTPHQKPAFLCPKKPQRSTRLSTNPSPDDSLRRLGILHCKETAPDPFSLTYQTFQIFPKPISMGRIQIFRSP